MGKVAADAASSLAPHVPLLCPQARIAPFTGGGGGKRSNLEGSSLLPASLPTAPSPGGGEEKEEKSYLRVSCKSCLRSRGGRIKEASSFSSFPHPSHIPPSLLPDMTSRYRDETEWKKSPSSSLSPYVSGGGNLDPPLPSSSPAGTNGKRVSWMHFSLFCSPLLSTCVRSFQTSITERAGEIQRTVGWF